MSSRASPERPNESWWKEHGGEEWRKEIDRRRSYQPHYAQQEKFLEGFIAGLAPARVLDYGCGFGRHERYLRKLPGIEIFGCDISQKMLEEAGRYLEDPAFAADRMRRIEQGGKLPYPDGFFDLAFTSEVLIHVSPEDLPPILAELQRVSRGGVLHVENVKVSGTRRENDEHSGCWLHDLVAAWSGRTVRVISGVVDRQDIYVVPLASAAVNERSAEGAGRAASVLIPPSLNPGADAVAMLELYQRSTQLAAENEHLLAREEDLSRQIDVLSRDVDDFRSSTAFKVVTRARGAIPMFNKVQGLARGTVQLAERAAGRASAEVAPTRKPSAPPEERAERKDTLAFGGIAAASSAASPEALVAARPQTLCLCHPGWRGIRAATYGQGEAVLEIPGIASDAHLHALTEFIVSTGARSVVVNGVPPGTLRLASALKVRAPEVNTQFVFHGSAAQHVTNPDEAILLESLAVLTRAGVVRRLGFVKPGMAEVFRAVGVDAMTVMNTISTARRPAGPPLGPDGKLHLGVFVPQIWHKNINTQLLAASMVPGAVVHVNELPSTPYLRRAPVRFVEHGLLPHHEFLAVLGQMQANLYVSLTECYPMTVLESLALGVPCITSHTSSLFDHDRVLFGDLVVTAHDSPLAVSERLLDVLARRAEIVPRAQAHLDRLNASAAKRWKEFLS